MTCPNLRTTYPGHPASFFPCFPGQIASSLMETRILLMDSIAMILSLNRWGILSLKSSGINLAVEQD